MKKLKLCLKRNVFLMAIGALFFGPLFLIYVYPHPGNIEQRKSFLESNHEERVKHIEEAIEKSKKQQYQGMTDLSATYRSRKDYAEMDELYWKEQLTLENKRYYEEIGELESFPLETGELIGFAALYAALFGMHLSSLSRVDN